MKDWVPGVIGLGIALMFDLPVWAFSDWRSFAVCLVLESPILAFVLVFTIGQIRVAREQEARNAARRRFFASLDAHLTAPPARRTESSF